MPPRAICIRRGLERIVLKAAQRAVLQGKSATHWLPHAHGTHALDRGAPVNLGQASLGPASDLRSNIDPADVSDYR